MGIQEKFAEMQKNFFFCGAFPIIICSKEQKKINPRYSGINAHKAQYMGHNAKIKKKSPHIPINSAMRKFLGKIALFKKFFSL